MTEDELHEIEERANLAGLTNTPLSLQPADVLALCRSLREAYRLGGQLQQERDVALEQLERLQRHLAGFSRKLGDVEKLLGMVNRGGSGGGGAGGAGGAGGGFPPPPGARISG